MVSEIPSFHGCWFLTGPTAAGKTAVALELAERVGAEIVSLDSMALYRDMDIGTAKPTPAERCRVPHHLLDVISPAEEFSVARYLEAARAAVAEIQQRGRRALLVGGTPLYLKAALRGMFEGPAADWALREALQNRAEAEGLVALHDELQQVDAPAARRIHPNDARRIIRALEVYQATGKPISQWQQEFDVPAAAPPVVWVLHLPRPVMRDRVAKRVDQMLDAGWVEEVRRLRERYPTWSRTASQAVGYRELWEHLQGRRSLEEAREAIVARTRQFVKRQMTWFRSLAECRWIELAGAEVPAEVAERLRQDATG